MSKETKSKQVAPKVNVAFRKYAIVFSLSFVVSFAVYAVFTNTAIKKVLSNSIGGVSSPSQFAVGSWFRYDPVGYDGLYNSKIYIITNITAITTAGDPVNGDRCVFEKFGDRTWYKWSIKVYWADGVEASDLYAYKKGDSPIPLWNSEANYLINAYNNRSSYSGAGFATGGNYETILKPMCPPVETSFRRDSPSAPFVYTYIVNGADGTTVFSSYEKDTNILYSFVVSRGPAWNTFVLSGWSANAQLRFDIPIPAVDVTMLPELQKSYEANLVFELVNADKVDLSILSNNTSFFKNVSSTVVHGSTYPIDVSGAPVQLNVTVRSYQYAEVKSDYITRTFVVNTAKTAGGSVGNTTIISVVAVGNDTIRVTWTAVSNASSYRVFVDGRFYESTASTSYDFRPPETNRNYMFSVVCDSNILNVSSVPSNNASVLFTVAGGVVPQGYAMQAVTAPFDYTVVIWIATIGVIAVIAVYAFNIMRCDTARKTGRGSTSACPAKYKQGGKKQ